MFYGYENEAEMRHFNPDIADLLVASARRFETNASTKGKKCVGSINGKTYRYDDHTQDEGQKVIQFQAEHGGNSFAWLET